MIDEGNRKGLDMGVSTESARYPSTRRGTPTLAVGGVTRQRR
jgi:hypothetical protein